MFFLQDSRQTSRQASRQASRQTEAGLEAGLQGFEETFKYEARLVASLVYKHRANNSQEINATRVSRSFCLVEKLRDERHAHSRCSMLSRVAVSCNGCRSGSLPPGSSLLSTDTPSFQ